MSQEYQTFSRKYRPQTFQDVLGQEAIVTTLKNALSQKRLANAYLFCGTRGTGKTTLARILAKALNCSALTIEGEPCNHCSSCLEVNRGAAIDVLEIDGASNRGIDDIRKLNETVGYAPSSGKYKIYIIDEVHMLTKEAFNALLKTLEEPPPQVKFFFATTELHKVLPTIVSRCQRFDLKTLSSASIKAKLVSISRTEQINAEEKALDLIAHIAGGSLRDAESLYDQVLCFANALPITVDIVSTALGRTPRHLFQELDQAICSHHLPFAFELSEALFSAGRDPTLFLEELADHFRTHAFAAISAKSPTLYTQEETLYIMDFLMRTLHLAMKTPFKRVGVEMVLLHLIRSKQRIPIESLVKRLTQLEQGAPPQAPESVTTKEIKTAPPAVAKLFEPPSPPTPSLPEEMSTPPPPAPVTPITEQPSSSPRLKQSKHETVMRFAAIELEGTIK